MPRAARPSSTGTLHTSLPPQAPSRLHPLRPAPSGRKQLGALCFQAAVASNRLLTRLEVGVSGSPFRMRRLPADPGSRGRLPPSTPAAAHKYSVGPEGAETDFPDPLLALAHLTPRANHGRRSLDSSLRLSGPRSLRGACATRDWAAD